MEESFKYWTRRILALVIIVPVVLVLCYSFVRYAYEPAFTAMTVMASGVLGFYFGARTAEGK